MHTEWIIYTTQGFGLTSALVAGVFLSFSDFVMRGLAAADARGGAQSMQMINRTVLRSVFLVMLLGLAPASLVFAACASLQPIGGASPFIVAAAAVYVVFVFLVTMFANVPMNNKLDRMAHEDAATADYWRRYGDVWTRWNHLRTLGSVAAAALYFIAAVNIR